MRQFNVAYDADAKKVQVLPVADDLPKASTMIGVIDDRDMAYPLRKDQLRTGLQEKNGKADPVLLHYVETILLRYGVTDLTDITVTASKDLKQAAEDARENMKNDTESADPKEQETITTAQREPVIK